MTRSLFLCLVIAGTTWSCLGAGAGAPLTAEDVLARMRANATSLSDFDAHIAVEIYEDGTAKLTQELRLSLLQPDKMRQEYLCPDYLAGNLSIIVKEKMSMYIAASETWYAKDLSTLSEAEQPWLGFRQLLRDVQDELENYAFLLVGMEDGAYRLRGTGESAEAVYGAIELWVDPTTYVPQRRLLYDTDENLIVDVRVFDVEETVDGVFVARRIETYDEFGALRNVIRYDSISVNQGLDPDLFLVPEGATP
jgi:outer membrane lipoprotein-sorting protein